MPPAPIADPARDFTAAPLARGVPQGHVYSGITDEPDSVNPFTAHGNTVRRYVLGFTHEGLLDADPQTGALRPALASAYEIAGAAQPGDRALVGPDRGECRGGMRMRVMPGTAGRSRLRRRKVSP